MAAQAEAICKRRKKVGADSLIGLSGDCDKVLIVETRRDPDSQHVPGFKGPDQTPD